MSIRLMSAIFESTSLSPTERLIMLALADHADDSGRCYPSILRLCQRTGLSERAVQTNIRKLSGQGYIKIIPGGGKGNSNLYFISANPAADAPFDAPKPRSRCTPQEMHPAADAPQTPHLLRSNPAADAPEPSGTISKPPSKAAREARGQSEKDRIIKLRADLIEAMGLTGSELNTSASFIVGRMSPAELALSLEVWSQDGLTDQQIVAAVRAKVQAEKQKDPSFIARSVRFFDGAIRDHAIRLKSGGGAGTRQRMASDDEAKRARWRRIANS